MRKVPRLPGWYRHPVAQEPGFGENAVGPAAAMGRLAFPDTRHLKQRGRLEQRTGTL